MTHAYLILAHNNFNLLEYLLKSLDHPDNAIYLHIDKKVLVYPKEKLQNCVKHSYLEIYQELSVSWGNKSIIDCELFLLKKSTQIGYDYYHLLSGTDMLVKPLDEIMEFFEKNKGKEFVHFFNDSETLPARVLRRVAYYHIFQRERYTSRNPVAKKFYTTINKGLLGIQCLLHVNRIRKSKVVFKYGSTWFSITHNFAIYVLQKSKWINKVFAKTNCGDEIFLQTILYNSSYKDNLYYKGFDNSYQANKRYIKFDPDTSKKHPYIWKMENYNKLINLNYLFARKFDENIDIDIVKKLYERNKPGSRSGNEEESLINVISKETR